MSFKEIIAVYSENHTRYINGLCGQNEELLNVIAGGTYSYHWVLKGKSKLSLAIRHLNSFTLLARPTNILQATPVANYKNRLFDVLGLLKATNKTASFLSSYLFPFHLFQSCLQPKELQINLQSLYYHDQNRTTDDKWPYHLTNHPRPRGKLRT
jgi:hypothetical protein